MSDHVRFKMVFVRTSVVTVCTTERLFSCMTFHMPRHFPVKFEKFPTHLACRFLHVFA